MNWKLKFKCCSGLKDWMFLPYHDVERHFGPLNYISPLVHLHSNSSENLTLKYTSQDFVILLKFYSTCNDRAGSSCNIVMSCLLYCTACLKFQLAALCKPNVFCINYHPFLSGFLKFYWSFIIIIILIAVNYPLTTFRAIRNAYTVDQKRYLWIHFNTEFF